MRDESQGIELEFVCRENADDKHLSGPIVSSPINYAATTSNDSTWKKSITCDMDTDGFCGFDSVELDTAKLCHQNLLESIKDHINKRSPKMFDVPNGAENGKKTSAEKASSKLLRKRKIDSTMDCDSSKTSAAEESEIFMANVFISGMNLNQKTFPNDILKINLSRSFLQDNDNKALNKQRQRVRYSNDDLFKPRSFLGGISRRRRGFHCNE